MHPNGAELVRRRTLPRLTSSPIDSRARSDQSIRAWMLFCISAPLAFGITGAQMTILMALSDRDADKRVPINVLSTLMRVDPSLVNGRLKLLEK